MKLKDGKVTFSKGDEVHYIYLVDKDNYEMVDEVKRSSNTTYKFNVSRDPRGRWYEVVGGGYAIDGHSERLDEAYYILIDQVLEDELL